MPEQKEARARKAPLGDHAPVVESPGRPIDLILLAAVLGLVVIGTIEVYSSSAVYALKRSGDAAYFLKRQLMWVGLGLGALWLGARTDPPVAGSPDLPAPGGGAGRAGRGPPGRGDHQRRAALVPARAADVPAGRARQARARHLSRVLARPQGRSGEDVHGRLRAAPRGVRRDDGAAAQAARPRLVGRPRRDDARLLFVAGTRDLVHHARGARRGAGRVSRRRRHAVAHAALPRVLQPRGVRATTRRTSSSQARIAIGSGGRTGIGLGDGQQTLGYMPEAHNDFILAPIGEELGLDRHRARAACCSACSCGAASARRSARATCSAATSRSASRSMFGVQALFNVGVVLGVVPNKGITLPLVSYGGHARSSSDVPRRASCSTSARGAPEPARAVANSARAPAAVSVRAHETDAVTAARA